MSDELNRCPACSAPLTQFGKFWICEEHGQVEPRKLSGPMRIFLSYGHDANAELVARILADLQNRGHDVWFDKSEIRFGDDWRRAITDGIVGSNRVLSFLSKYSTRDPGVCLDELAIAIGYKGANIQTILVESETEVKAPPSIGHIQWLDMHDWKERRAADELAWESWYQGKLAEIVRVIESEQSRAFAGEISALEEALKPISSDSRIAQLLKKPLVGRTWLFDAVDQWRNGDDRSSRLFWITGAPGVGKSAFAAHLAHYGRDKVIAVQFIEYDKPDHRNPQRIVRTLAFQLATRLPDYRKLLLALPEINELDRKNPAELFDYLLANPLKLSIGGGRERYLIVIDALDEAGGSGRNELVEMLARNAPRLPNWIGIVATSRPESDVVGPLQGLNPITLDTSTESNRADIREYLHRELATQLNGRTNADRLIEQILDKSEGVFLYAERFCDDVQQGHLSLDRPDQFPQGLGGVFYQYFKRQFPDIEKYRKDVRPALRAILAAREPLPVEILQRLFNWQDEELHDFARPIASLFPLTSEADYEVIKPYHKSLAEWQTDECKAGCYFVSKLEGNRFLAGNLRVFVNQDGYIGTFVRRNLPLHLALSADHSQLVDSLQNVVFLRELRWKLPDLLLEAAFSVWPPQGRAFLEVIPIAFASCARGLSLRATGFPFLHEDTIESVRRSGSEGDFWVSRKDGTRMPLAEMEPNDSKMYEFIASCRRMLRTAFDFSSDLGETGSRTWLASFLDENTQLKDELEDIALYYERTHFGPSLRASETVFMWESMVSCNADKEARARASY
jgi:hypothetical protein